MDEQVYMVITLELSLYDLHRFEPKEPAETRVERLALTRGLLPGYMYTVMPVLDKEVVRVKQVVSDRSYIGER